MSKLPSLLVGVALGIAASAIGFLHVSLDLSRYALSAFLIVAAAGLIAVVGLVFISYRVQERLGTGHQLLGALLESAYTAVVSDGEPRATALARLREAGVTVGTAALTAFATLRAFGFLFAAITVAVSSAILVATLMQVDRLDQQNQLSEASRRAALINELTALLTEIDEEMDQFEQRSGLQPKRAPRAGEGPTFVRDGVPLTKRLVWRVVALSRSLKPYRFLDGSALSPSELSPERAQLLISLVASGIDMKDILRMGSFESSYLKGAELSNVFLSDAKISGSSFVNANLIQSNLSEAIARDADFSRAVLFNVDMTKADLQRSIFIGARMPEPHQLSDAKLNGANLDGALVSSPEWIEQLAKLDTPPEGLDFSTWTVEPKATDWLFNGQKAGIAHVVRRKPKEPA